MSEIRDSILWIDDDIGPGAFAQGDITIEPAQSLKEAESLVRGLGQKLLGVIVDIRVPQDGWGDRLFEYPGIQYVKSLRERLPSSLPIVMYGVAIDDQKRKMGERAGADATLQKGAASLNDVIDAIQQRRAKAGSTPTGKGSGRGQAI